MIAELVHYTLGQMEWVEWNHFFLLTALLLGSLAFLLALDGWSYVLGGLGLLFSAAACFAASWIFLPVLGFVCLLWGGVLFALGLNELGGRKIV